MTKEKAIQRFGEKVVDHAKQCYETMSDKVLFECDMVHGDEVPADEQTQKEYLWRSKSLIK